MKIPCNLIRKISDPTSQPPSGRLVGGGNAVQPPVGNWPDFAGLGLMALRLVFGQDRSQVDPLAPDHIRAGARQLVNTLAYQLDRRPYLDEFRQALEEAAPQILDAPGFVYRPDERTLDRGIAAMVDLARAEGLTNRTYTNGDLYLRERFAPRRDGSMVVGPEYSLPDALGRPERIYAIDGATDYWRSLRRLRRRWREHPRPGPAEVQRYLRANRPERAYASPKTTIRAAVRASLGLASEGSER